MLNKMLAVFWISLLLSGCALIPKMLSHLQGKEGGWDVSAQVGDNNYKGTGSDQNVKHNLGQIIGRDMQRFEHLDDVFIANLTTLHLLIMLLFTFLSGWFAGCRWRRWSKEKNGKNNKTSV